MIAVKAGRAAGIHGPLVSIVILNWKDAEATVACVRHVLSQEVSFSFEVIVVDNGSGDGSSERFCREWDDDNRVWIVGLESNYGYAGGNNQALSSCSGDFVIILNNDTVPLPGWLQGLVEAISPLPKRSLVTSNVINASSDVAIFSLPWDSRLWWSTNLFCQSIDVPGLRPGKGGLVRTSAVNGASFIFRRVLLGSLPGGRLFDKDYFIYAEETKLSWLVQLIGGSVWIASASRVMHVSNAVRKRQGWRLYNRFVFLGTRNRIVNFLTLFQWHTVLRLSPWAIFLEICYLLDVRNIVSRLAAYVWIFSSSVWLWHKRREVQSLRRVGDASLLQAMPADFLSSVFCWPLNVVYRVYCRLIGLHFLFSP